MRKLTRVLVLRRRRVKTKNSIYFSKQSIAPVQGVHDEIFEPKFGFGVAKGGHAA
jgi:hypothetical protein